MRGMYGILTYIYHKLKPNAYIQYMEQTWILHLDNLNEWLKHGEKTDFLRVHFQHPNWKMLVYSNDSRAKWVGLVVGIPWKDWSTSSSRWRSSIMIYMYLHFISLYRSMSCCLTKYGIKTAISRGVNSVNVETKNHKVRFLATLGSQCCDWKAQAHPKKNIEKSVFQIRLTVAFLVLLKKKLVFSLSFLRKLTNLFHEISIRSSLNSPTQGHSNTFTPPIRTVQEAPWFWALQKEIMCHDRLDRPTGGKNYPWEYIYIYTYIYIYILYIYMVIWIYIILPHSYILVLQVVSFQEGTLPIRIVEWKNGWEWS